MLQIFRGTSLACAAVLSTCYLSRTKSSFQCEGAADPLGTVQHKKSPRTSAVDCADPVCKSTSDMFTKALQGVAAADKASARKAPLRCPLDVNELGNSTWDLIHTLAAYYPENPSNEQKLAAVQFFQALSLLYPCHICAEDFIDSVSKNPPR